MHVDFDWPRKTHTHWIRATIFNFQFLDSIWHQNYKKPKNSKAEYSRYISSNFNGMFYWFILALFIDVIFMANTEMWNKSTRKRSTKSETNQNINSTKLYGYWPYIYYIQKTPLGNTNTRTFIQMNKMFKRCINHNKHEQEKR